MSMKKTVLMAAAGTLLATSALAAEPVKLSDGQMDDVTAGFRLLLALGTTGGGGTGTFGLGAGTFDAGDSARTRATESVSIGTGGDVSIETTDVAEASAFTSGAFASTVAGETVSFGTLSLAGRFNNP